MFKFFKILLNFILKNFVHFFYKTFSKVFDEYIFAECFSPNRNFGDAIAVQDFSGIHYESLSDVPPPPNKNSGAVTVTEYILYTSDITGS